MVVNTITIVAM